MSRKIVFGWVPNWQWDAVKNRKPESNDPWVEIRVFEKEERAAKYHGKHLSKIELREIQ